MGECPLWVAFISGQTGPQPKPGIVRYVPETRRGILRNGHIATESGH